MSVEAIRSAAEARIRDLVLEPALGLGDGRADGIHWKCRNPQRADRTIGSFVVDIGGRAPGRFKEFAGDEGGDVIDLVSYCLHGPGRYQGREERGAAIRWLGRWTGIEEDGRRQAETPEAAAARRARIEADIAARQAQEAAGLAERGARAKRWWLKEGEAITGTPVETYIERARGVPLSAVRLTGAIKALAPTMRNPHWQMFAAMARGGELRAVHLTRLTPDGQKDLSADPVKRMWGDVRGAVVRVSKGELGCSPEAAARRGLSAPAALCEGIEDALTLALLWPEWQVWAAGSVANLAAVAEAGWPAAASEMILVADNDAPGSAAARAFGRAKDAWLAVAGDRTVRVLTPREFKDVNDAWRASA